MTVIWKPAQVAEVPRLPRSSVDTRSINFVRKQPNLPKSQRGVVIKKKRRGFDYRFVGAPAKLSRLSRMLGNPVLGCPSLRCDPGPYWLAKFNNSNSLHTENSLIACTIYLQSRCRLTDCHIAMRLAQWSSPVQCLLTRRYQRAAFVLLEYTFTHLLSHGTYEMHGNFTECNLCQSSINAV